MSQIVKYLFKIYFDYQSWHKTMTDNLRQRFEMFQSTTLRSLLCQNKMIDDIVVICDPNNAHITSAFKWHERLYVSYDCMKEYIEKQNSDYLCVIRIDSDDLYHCRALGAMMDAVMSNLKIDEKGRRTFVYRKGITWDRINTTIAPYKNSGSPFFAHLFKKDVYKCHDLFWKLNNTCHGHASGASDNDAVGLPDNMICVVKHHLNISSVEQKRELLSDEKKFDLYSHGKLLAMSPFEVMRFLASFNVSQMEALRELR